jgi:hypothetical protein
VDAIRWWTLCLALGIPSALLMVVNWFGFIDWLRKDGTFSFVLPWFGGIFCAIACWGCPWEEIRAFWWVPLVLDASISLMVLWLLWLLVRRVARWIGWRFPSDHEPNAP